MRFGIYKIVQSSTVSATGNGKDSIFSQTGGYGEKQFLVAIQ